MAEQLTKKSIKAKISKDNNKPIVIDFYGDWCAPCKRFIPIFEKISNEFKELDFAKYNIEEDEKVLAIRLGITSIPTIIFFNKGEEIERIYGEQSENEFRENVKKVFKKIK